MITIVMCLVSLISTLTILGSPLWILMVKCISFVVYVMLYLSTVMSPPPELCNPSLRTVVKLCTLFVFLL